MQLKLEYVLCTNLKSIQSYDCTPIFYKHKFGSTFNTILRWYIWRGIYVYINTNLSLCYMCMLRSV